MDAVATGRTYPLPTSPSTDPRFTWGLTLAVRQVLAEHGYPEVTHAADFVALQGALFGFLYGPASPAFTGTEPAVERGPAEAGLRAE